MVSALITHGKKVLPNLFGITSYSDPTGIAHQIYGAATPCVYIIRPDGYIGYRSKKIDESRLDEYFSLFVLGSNGWEQIGEVGGPKKLQSRASVF